MGGPDDPNMPPVRLDRTRNIVDVVEEQSYGVDGVQPFMVRVKSTITGGYPG